MAVNLGQIKTHVPVIVDRGIQGVNITDADVRTGKVSIDNKGKKVIGNHIARFIESQTSDGTAVPADINLGKTLYVAGKKITGTYIDLTVENTMRAKTEQNIAAETIPANSFVRIDKEYSSTTIGASLGTSSPTTHSSITNVYDINTVSLTKNKLLMTYRVGIVYYARIISFSGVTATLGDAISIHNVTVTNIHLIKVSDTKIFFVYTTGSGNNVNLVMKPITVDTTNNTVTVSDEILVKTDRIVNLSFAHITDNKFIIAYSNGSFSVTQVVTLNYFNEIFLSPVVQYNNYITNSIKLVKLTENKFFLAYNYSSSSYGVCNILSISNDNIITVGALYTFREREVDYISAVSISPTRVVLFYYDEYANPLAQIRLLNINNTTITQVDYNSLSGHPYLMYPFYVQNNQILVMHRDSNSISYATMSLFTASDTSLSYSNADFRIAGLTSSSIFSFAQLSVTKFAAVYVSGTSRTLTTEVFSFNKTTGKGSSVVTDDTDNYVGKVYKTSSINNTISGIAKNSASAGDSIDVYTPLD